MVLINNSPSNRNLIFKYIMQVGKTSHREISIALDISMPTVLSYTHELMTKQLIKHDGLFESTGGRKAKILVPNANAKIAIGIDITKGHVSIVQVNLLGQVNNVERKSLRYQNNDSYYAQLAEIFSGYLERNPIDSDKIIGVGISVPGIIDADGIKISYSHALGIQDTPCRLFQDAIPYPSICINDANAACLAELSVLEYEGLIVYLSLSNSVGGAISIGNKLFFGENQRSGEFGHMTLVPDGAQCYCGKSGCTDAYCSALVLTNYSDNGLHSFFEKLEDKDQESLAMFDDYLNHLAITINNLRMSFDAPIILGGYVGGYLEPYFDQLRNKLAERNTFGDDSQYILGCTYRFEASAVGAAICHIKRFIDSV